MLMVCFSSFHPQYKTSTNGVVEMSREEAKAAIEKRMPERRAFEKETDRRMGNDIEALYNKMRRRG